MGMEDAKCPSIGDQHEFYSTLRLFVSMISYDKIRCVLSPLLLQFLLRHLSISTREGVGDNKR